MKDNYGSVDSNFVYPGKVLPGKISCRLQAFLRIHESTLIAAAKLLQGYPWMKDNYGSVDSNFVYHGKVLPGKISYRLKSFLRIHESTLIAAG